ncbi:hypothetical protein [Raoultella terrigena]|uniref:hypothetical protein n=1 Tax=Raoultella terrigena TaxID=577 RepID=UPI00384C7989
MPTHPKLSVLEMELYTKYGVYPGRFDYFLQYFGDIYSSQVILENLSDEEVSKSIWDYFVKIQRLQSSDRAYATDEELVKHIARYMYTIPDRRSEGSLFDNNGKPTARGVEAFRYFQKKWLKFVDEEIQESNSK